MIGRSVVRLGSLIVVLAGLLISASPGSAADPPQRPYSCRLYDDEQRKCAYGSCDHRVLDRLRKECLIAGGRP